MRWFSREQCLTLRHSKVGTIGYPLAWVAVHAWACIPGPAQRDAALQAVPRLGLVAIACAAVAPWRRARRAAERIQIRATHTAQQGMRLERVAQHNEPSDQQSELRSRAERASCACSMQSGLRRRAELIADLTAPRSRAWRIAHWNRAHCAAEMSTPLGAAQQTQQSCTSAGPGDVHHGDWRESDRHQCEEPAPSWDNLALLRVVI